MSIPTTYTKLLSMARATSGINHAPEELPIALPEDSLPITLCRVGKASWNQHAVGLPRQVRTYYLDTFCAKLGEGIDPDEGYKKCLTPLQNLGNTFVRNVTLDGTVDQVGVGAKPQFTDGGVTILRYSGADYHGFTLALEITEKPS